MGLKKLNWAYRMRWIREGMKGASMGSRKTPHYDEAADTWPVMG